MDELSSDNSSISAFQSVRRLVNGDLGAPIGVSIDPGSLLLLHIDTAVAPIASGCLIAAGIVVRELSAGTILVPPPGVMDKVAIIMIFNGIVDIRWRVPVGRTLGLGRREDRR